MYIIKELTTIIVIYKEDKKSFSDTLPFLNKRGYIDEKAGSYTL